MDLTNGDVGRGFDTWTMDHWLYGSFIYSNIVMEIEFWKKCEIIWKPHKSHRYTNKIL